MRSITVALFVFIKIPSANHPDTEVVLRFGRADDYAGWEMLNTILKTSQERRQSDYVSIFVVGMPRYGVRTAQRAVPTF